METTPDLQSIIGTFASGITDNLWAVAALAIPVAAVLFIAPKAVSFFKRLAK